MDKEFKIPIFRVKISTLQSKFSHFVFIVSSLSFLTMRIFYINYYLIMAMFACLIICSFQLVFLAGTVFFSHNKSAGTVFRLIFSANINKQASKSLNLVIYDNTSIISYINMNISFTVVRFPLNFQMHNIQAESLIP